MLSLTKLIGLFVRQRGRIKLICHHQGLLEVPKMTENGLSDTKELR